MRWLFVYFFLSVTSFAGALSQETEILYLTWQKDPTTTMTISWLSPLAEQQNYIEYKEKNDFFWQTSSPSSVTALPKKYPLALQRVELLDLKPGSDYLFRLRGKEKIRSFKTLPALLEKPLKIVIGGDLYPLYIHWTRLTNRAAAETSPDFIIFGGDLAYASANHFWQSENIDRWIELVRSWSEDFIIYSAKEQDSRLIPIISAIGNHDVNGRYGKSFQQAPMFHAIFPSNNKPHNYQVVDVGNYLSIFILDSGHTSEIAAEQTDWLQKQLKMRQKIPYKLAVYHVPAWPSVRSPYGVVSSLLRKHWVPLFEKNKIDIAFEHHDHAYKRTERLLKKNIDPAGIVYVGDGAWGVGPRQPLTSKQRYYLAKTAAERHFITLDIEKNLLAIKALSPQGKLIDSFTIEK